MKKLIFSAAVLASAFFAASCQQEMLDPQAEGTTVTYTVEVPDAIATKAIGDEITAVDKVYFEVYRAADVNDPTKAPVYAGDRPMTNNVASFDLEFVKNQEFVVLFWAQNSTLVNTDVNSETGMYNINDLRAIQLVNPGTANNAAAQVFAGKDAVSDCVSAVNGNVTLIRPVSQINVYTTTESLSFGDVTIGLDKSSMTVAGLYNTFNVATGDAVVSDENKATFEYTEAAVPNVSADNTAYTYVAMNYVGFAPKAGATVTVDFTINTSEAVDIDHSVSNVPVKPNYRTNIVGNLISATTDYNVTLNNNWADAGKDMEVLADGIVKNINGDYEISTAKGLAYAISNVFANGGTFYVLKNIDMTGVSYDPADVPAGTTVHIVGETPVVTRSSGSVVITGLTKPLLNTVQNGAAASFANIHIDAPIDFVKTNKGVVAFNNCDNTTTDPADDLVGDNTNGTIAEEGTDINNLALEEALAAKASSIKLAGDITASEIIVVEYPVTIDGCGHKLTSTAGRAINVSGADGVTIKNLVIECTGERAINVINNATNVTIDNVTATAANYTVNVALSAPGAVVKIENCTLNGLNTVNVASPGAKVSVDNSTINCNDNNTTDGESYAALCLNKAAVGAEIIATNTVVNVTDGSDSSKGRNGAEDGTVTINDSTKDVTVTIAVITYPGSDNYYGFETVASAIKFAKETDVISLIRNISVEETIVVNADKTVTIDLNGKTLNTAFADGSTTNHIYAFTNNGTLTLKNGTINTRGIFNYGTMTLESGTINAIDGNGGYGVRNYPGAEFIMNGGTIATTLEDDNKVNNGGYDATTLRVDEGASAIINGGNINNICDYTFALENHGTTTVNRGTLTSIHTTVANYGTLNVAGGSFTINGLEGVTAHALWAAGGTTTINGGTFDGKDNYNGFNVDASEGAVVNITGGEFLPVHSGSLYGEGTINVTGGEFFDDPSARVAEDYKAVQNADGKWEVVAKTYVAQDGDKKKYESLQEAFNVGGNITLLCDVTVDETVVLADAKTAILDLNGKTLSHANEEASYVINNRGTLTITGNGTVNARGIYNGYDADQNYVVDAKLTIENGTFNPKGTNGGAAIFNYGSVLINGGKFTTSGAYSLNNQAGSEMTINYAIVEGGIYNEGKLLTIKDGNIQTTRAGYSHVIYHNGTELVIEGGSFMGNGNEVINANSSIATINGGTFTKDPNGKTSYLMAGAKMTINAGIFNAHTSNPAGHPVRPDVIVKGGTFNYKHTNLAEGYEIVDNDNGTWTVVKVQPNNEI